MKVLVTGGTGFIGKRLVSSLNKNGYHVTILSRCDNYNYDLPNGVKIAKCDLIFHSEPLEQHVIDCNIIYNCAGEIKNELKMHSLHIDGTQRLLDAVLSEAKKSNRVIHWVQLSSVGVYGPPEAISEPANVKRIITENSPLNPVGEYEKTKTKSDKLLLKAAETGLISYTIIRPSNVFSNDMPNNSIRSLGYMIKKGLFFYIGNSEAVVTYVHVDDVVRLLILSAEDTRARDKILNLSNDCSLEKIITAIAKAQKVTPPKLRLPEFLVRLIVSISTLGIKLPLTKERVDALVSRTQYSSIKLENELDFIPMMSVPDTIGEVSITKMT